LTLVFAVVGFVTVEVMVLPSPYYVIFTHK